MKAKSRREQAGTQNQQTHPKISEVGREKPAKLIKAKCAEEGTGSSTKRILVLKGSSLYSMHCGTKQNSKACLYVWHAAELQTEHKESINW